jgi:hypothetical protein
MELYVQSKYSYFYTGDATTSNKLAEYLNQKRSNVLVKKEERNQYRLALLGGLRILYKIERFCIFTDARLAHELDLYNNPTKRFTDPDLYLNHNYVIPDIMLDNIDISVGLIYNFSYKVKSKY